MKNFENLTERKFLSKLLANFAVVKNLSTKEWAESRRFITNKETSFGVGKFKLSHTPYMEYVYTCFDNPYIPKIVSMKSARIAWTEATQNYIGQRIEVNPSTIFMGFPTGGATKKYAKEKWATFIDNVEALKKIVNFGIAENRKSIYEYDFPNGHLNFGTLGAISNQKSANIATIIIEEPDDAPDDVSGQGDTFANLDERQKSIPLTKKKFIFGGTPTFKDLSRVESAMKKSNWMIFKAECHKCGNLVSMDHTGFDNIKYSKYSNRHIDEIYGEYDPNTAIFLCPFCETEWSFEQKNLNIKAGLKHGFTDHTGNFSYGWHPTRPNVTDTFGFAFSELMSPFEGSNFVELSKKKILADLELKHGKELLFKSFTNNSMGKPYSSGSTSLEKEDMIKYRLSYPEGICPLDAYKITIGIDTQDNRFAIIKRAWGENGKSYLISWKEIFGNVLNIDDPVWNQLEEEIRQEIPHVSGKMIRPAIACMDAADNSELVYRFVLHMQQYNSQNNSDPTEVFACKGVKELRYSDDEIYREPTEFDQDTFKKSRKTLAQTMGVIVYNVGAHKCHQEILRRISLVKNYIENPASVKSDLFFWNEQAYGLYEEQMTSCKKTFFINRSGEIRESFHLIPGKHKEAMDAEKLAFYGHVAIGIRSYTWLHWKVLRDYYNPNII